jgi:putative ABC transport system substrate-binding protein
VGTIAFSLAADLVSRNVDVIVTSGTPGILAAKSATSTVSIVFTGGRDLVATGVVASMARPGGNLTGISTMNTELHPKRLDLLSQLIPETELIALLVNPNNATTERHQRCGAGGAREGDADPYPECRHRKRD